MKVAEGIRCFVEERRRAFSMRTAGRFVARGWRSLSPVLIFVSPSSPSRAPEQQEGNSPPSLSSSRSRLPLLFF